MMKCSRPAAPKILKNAEQWNTEYTNAKAANPSYAFQWKHRNGKPINQHLLPLLREMTPDHCSYCDDYPVEMLSVGTIDHFRPKSSFPQLVYQWENLFLCCNRCQAAKKESFSELLLRPDEAEYSFNRYFMIQYDSGEIQINPLAASEDQQKAAYTIEILDLNNKALCISRQREMRNYNSAYDIHSYCYRYLFDQDLI